MDSLDTLYLMGLEEEFEKAKEWVQLSLDFERVREPERVCVCLCVCLCKRVCVCMCVQGSNGI